MKKQDFFHMCVAHAAVRYYNADRIAQHNPAMLLSMPHSDSVSKLCQENMVEYFESKKVLMKAVETYLNYYEHHCPKHDKKLIKVPGIGEYCPVNDCTIYPIKNL